MAKKIKFSLHICTLAERDGFHLMGASARNVLQAFYGPEFCVVKFHDLDMLIDREIGEIGNEVPGVHRFKPGKLAKRGLHIHKSVIQRLEANLYCWKKTNDLFMADYGFGAPNQLKDAAKSLVEFARKYDQPESDFAAIVRWA